MTYEKFIQLLQSLNNTDEVLVAIFNYFKENVSYNYDELQVIKYNRYENELLIKIKNYISENKTNISEEFKNELIKLLDNAFFKIEGRPLSERNRERWFRSWGSIIHHEAQPERNGIIKVPARKAYDEVIQIQSDNYPPVYKNGLLIDGVCGEYSVWIKSICDKLNIPCLIVRGKGTTGHAWNLIYVKERNKWINFDMTMVRFYLDNWTRNYGEPKKWIFATNDEMFRMQPQRIIEQLIGDNSKVLFNSKITSSNQEELNSFLEEFQPTKIRK